MDAPIILIVGPTASGKSSLALRLAEKMRGDIINADSMQVYRELRILTARPSEEDESRAPHFLYGIRSIEEPFSAAEWCDLAAAQIEHSQKSRRTPIVVGGTGLYFKALLEGLAQTPDIPDDIRREVRAAMDERGSAALHDELAACDPVLAARLETGDRQRVSRGLEVYRATGKPLSHWQQLPTKGPLTEADGVGEVCKVALLPPRAWLNERCESRFDMMIEAGAIDEVAALSTGQDDLPALKALGVPHLAAFLAGTLSQDEAVERAVTATRQYAKRQYTWIRHQCTDWQTIVEKDSERIYQSFFSIIRKNSLTG